ncbi:CAP domain-containing protein [Hyalangium rubrum]|uniref:CAP domain-containing protein n=1 Tax=Hyalangium rubrum TaxID=3103134 RepID=A0ABU5H9I5_9BACT|nr:CAP domain-containing protein [Hyalangium sp. s54d21]MDY7230138.1 CAP domain-containing protein [Hyalangium sp. s54d21]
MRHLLARCFPMLLCSWLAGCDFGEASPEPDGGTLTDGGVQDPSEQSPLARDMLAAHNQVRATASPAPVPALAPLAWSVNAATTAQAWADQCKFEHNSKRGNLGENIAAATQGGLSNTGVVTNWAAEAASYDYGLNACAPGKQCGHYTQIVWRNTTHVGCAMKLCDKNSPFQGFTRWEFWVCNYSPPGNFVGQRPY